MRPNCSTLLLLTCLAIPACHHSRSNASGTLIASATIGPAGGEVAITSGDYAGLRLQVAAGSLAAPTELRIVEEQQAVYAAGELPLQYAEPIGLPFRIEPVDLVFAVTATLRLPYRVPSIYGTAPGNVRARQQRNGNRIDLDPAFVDVSTGRIDVRTTTLGSFRVVSGPVAPSIDSYRQLQGETVALVGGFAFAVEPVPTSSPFAGTDAVRWRITGPGVQDVFYFAGDSVRARESVLQDWRETWNETFPVWSYGPLSLPPGTFTTSTTVSRPIGQPQPGGTMTAAGGWTWSEPRFVGAELVYDVLQLRLDLTWNRQDLNGVGQRSYRFWFTPGRGLLAFSQDGVVHERQTL
jgi:hypothetical protein